MYITATESDLLTPIRLLREFADVPIKEAITTEVKTIRIRDLILIKANIKSPTQTMLNRVFEVTLIE